MLNERQLSLTINDVPRACLETAGKKMSAVVELGKSAVSRNFSAVDEEGQKVVIKFASCKEHADIIVEHFKVIDAASGVHCLYGGGSFPWEGTYVIYLTYCEGEEPRFESYDKQRIEQLVNAYVKLSGSMRGSTRLLAPFPQEENLNLADEYAKRNNLSGLKWILKSVDRKNLRYHPEEMTVIHGDMHYANFRFKPDGEIGFFDVMDFRPGYETDDFIRLVLCSAERMKWYDWFRYKALFCNFRQLVLTTPYSSHKWHLSINGYFLRKIVKRIKKGSSFGLFTVLNLRFRNAFYNRLRKIAMAADTNRRAIG